MARCQNKTAVPSLSVVETIDSLKKANEMNKVCAARDIKLKIFLQINTSGEDNKHGVAPSASVELAKHVQTSCPNLELAGVMTIGEAGHDSDGVNPDFTVQFGDAQLATAGIPRIHDLLITVPDGMSAKYIGGNRSSFRGQHGNVGR
jgi:uncharacterized pyridoxal phosphate-containing UPF0001 family protein